MREHEIWKEYEQVNFFFEGRKANLVFPKTPDEQKNWTLKMEYCDAFPETEAALVKKGFHAAYLQNKTRFATKEDCDAKERFIQYMHETYGLREKCVPVGMSCGGAHAVNFARYYPESVACMFLDAPVLNFSSYPGKLGNAACEEVWEKEFTKAYPDMTRARLLSSQIHPMNGIEILKEHGIPIIMSYGTEDCTVDYNENGALFAEEYSAHPELLTVLPRNLQGHHPHGFPEHPEKIVDLIVKFC